VRDGSSFGFPPGDVVLSVNGISGLSNFQVVEMLRKGQGIFNLVCILGLKSQDMLANALSCRRGLVRVPASAGVRRGSTLACAPRATPLVGEISVLM
jgi:hypothetical protein